MHRRRAVPIYQSTSFVFENSDHAAALFGLQQFGNIYSRIMNPTTDVLEKRVASLENGVAALATASGQAAQLLAITSLMESATNGLRQHAIWRYLHAVRRQLPPDRYRVTFVEPDDPENFRKAITSEDEMHVRRDDQQPARQRAGYRSGGQYRARAQYSSDD